MRNKIIGILFAAIAALLMQNCHKSGVGEPVNADWNFDFSSGLIWGNAEEQTQQAGQQGGQQGGQLGAQQQKYAALSKVAIVNKGKPAATIENFVYDANGVLSSIDYKDHNNNDKITRYEFIHSPGNLIFDESYPFTPDSGVQEIAYGDDALGHLKFEVHILKKPSDPPVNLYEIGYTYNPAYTERTGKHSNDPSYTNEMTFNADGLPGGIKICSGKCQSTEFIYDNKKLKSYTRQFMETVTAEIVTDQLTGHPMIIKASTMMPPVSVIQIVGTWDGDKLIKETVNECPDKNPCTNPVAERSFEYTERDTAPAIPPRAFLLPRVKDSLLFIDNNDFLFGKDGMGMGSWID